MPEVSIYFSSLLITVAVPLFFFGIRTLTKVFRLKELLYFKASDGLQKFSIDKPGRYSISIVGGFHIKNFYARVVNLEGGQRPDLYKYAIGAKFFKAGMNATEWYFFGAEQSGTYSIEIPHLDKIQMKDSMLISKRLFEKPKSSEKLHILIREYSPPLTFVFSLTATVIGANMLLWGVGLLLSHKS